MVVQKFNGRITDIEIIEDICNNIINMVTCFVCYLKLLYNKYECVIFYQQKSVCVSL